MEEKITKEETNEEEMSRSVIGQQLGQRPRVSSEGLRKNVYNAAVCSYYSLEFIDVILKARSRLKTMTRWRGKTAVVTGAASGIGAATAKALLEEGMNVAGFDVSYDHTGVKRIQVPKRLGCGDLYELRCDLAKENEILECFGWVKNHLGGVDVMVNNAGIIHYSKIIESDTSVFRQMLDVDVLAVAICTREAVSSMRQRDVEGHVFNVNSLLGHEIPEGVLHEGWNLYPSCKHATVAMTNVVRRELINVKAKVRMTSISPGLVETKITSKTPALRDLFQKIPALVPTDIAEAIVYALTTRPEVQITELTIRRTGES